MCVVTKLKYHRLKPGGVRVTNKVLCSYKVEVPPAKAWGCPSDALPESNPKCYFTASSSKFS